MNDDVRVTISADSSNFNSSTGEASDSAQRFAGSLGTVASAMPRATLSAADFAAAMQSVGNNLSKITPEMLGLGSSTDGMSRAIFNATSAARGAAVTFAAFSTAGLGVDAAFKSAAESADVFSKALNPTPLQQLRSLTGTELPAAFRVTQTATQAVIGALFNLDGGFKSAAQSADVFNRELGRASPAQLRNALASLPPTQEQVAAEFQTMVNAATGVERTFKSAAESADVFAREMTRIPVAQLRAALTETASSGAATYQSLQQNIDAANRIGPAFKSAADSATVFTKALDPSPLTTLRSLMAQDIPAAATATAVNFQAVIDAATGVDRAFKSAEDSAAVFAKALDPTPLQQMRDLMGQVPAVSKTLTTDFQALINATTGVDRTFKSAADSADVFAREITRIPTAQLRKSLSEVASAGNATFQSLQQNINAANRIGTAFKSAEDSARTFQQALDPSPLQKMRSLMADEVPAAAHGSATGFAGITREIVVLGHEAMTGNFSRIPGSLMVLMERSGSLMTKIGELAQSFTFMQGVAIGAIAAVIGAIGAMIARAIEAANSIRQIGNAAAGMGQNTVQARAQAAGLAQDLGKIGIGQTEALKVAGGLQQITAASAAQRAELADLAIAFSKALGETPEKATEILVGALSKGAGGVRGLMDQYKLWDAQSGLSQRTQLNLAEATHDSSAAVGLAVSALSTRFAEYQAQVKAFRASDQAGDFEFQSGPGQKMALPDISQKAESPAVAQQRDETAGHTTELTKGLALERDLAAAWEQYRTAGTDAERQVAAEAQRAIQVEIQLNKERGNSTWEQNQQAALNKSLTDVAAHATSSKQLAMEENRTRVAFWEQAAMQSGLTEGQINIAKANATRARLALAGEELRGGEAAAKQSLQIKLATLNEEQAANHDDFTKVMQIEQQKIDLLRASGAMGAKLLQEELTKEDNLLREQAAKQLALNEQTLAQQRQQDTSAIAEKRALLDEEVADHTISKAQEMTILRQFAEQKRASELQSLTDLLATLDVQSDAYHKLYQQIGVLQQQWATESRRLNREATADIAQQWQRATAPISSAIDSQVSAVVQGNETIGLASAKMLGGIVTGYAQMGVKKLVQLASDRAMELAMGTQTEAAKTSIVAGGAATRGAITTTETARDNASLLARVGRWLFGESAKTTATTTNTAIRAGVGTTETASENAGVLVRISRWLFGEGAKTAATTTGASARAIALSAEQIAGINATGLAARLSIAAAAAVAAAWAFADSASAGPPGLIAAPGVAAATEATVMAFQVGVPSLAVGAYDVPRDMNANLHAGEMVVPETFASGIRGALGSGGGGGGGDMNLTYAPNVSAGTGNINSMMRQQAASMKSYMWHATRNGALAVPGRG